MAADTLPVHLHRVCDGHFIFSHLHRNQMTLKGTTYHMHHNFPCYTELYVRKHVHKIEIFM